jgi:hypothetical protein
VIRAWFERLAHWPAARGVRFGRRAQLAALVALTALGLPLAAWGWSWLGALLAPSPASHASPVPPPPPAPRPASAATTFSADLGRGPTPPAGGPSRALAEPGAAERVPDPFEGAADDAVSLKLLERKLKIKEAELKLAQLERQIRDLREGAGAGPRPAAVAGLPSAPPALRALPPVPPLGEAPPAAPRQTSAPPPAPAPAPPPPAAPPAPVWPVVRLVSLGAEPFALVEVAGHVAQVGRGDQLDDMLVESIDLNGVRFRHLPSDQQRFALVAGEAAARTARTP